VLCRTRSLMQPIAKALAARKIALQSMDAQAFRRFDWSRPSVKLVTLHSAKGLEFPLVVLAGLQTMPYEGASLQDELRLLYVGMTRATHQLVLSARGPSEIVERVKDSLIAVAQQFAAHAA